MITCTLYTWLPSNKDTCWCSAVYFLHLLRTIFFIVGRLKWGKKRLRRVSSWGFFCRPYGWETLPRLSLPTWEKKAIASCDIFIGAFKNMALLSQGMASFLNRAKLTLVHVFNQSPPVVGFVSVGKIWNPFICTAMLYLAGNASVEIVPLFGTFTPFFQTRMRLFQMEGCKLDTFTLPI